MSSNLPNKKSALAGDISFSSGPGFKASILPLSETSELTLGACSDFNFKKHSHPEYTIGIVLSGSEAIYRDGSYHPAGEGSLYFYQPDQIHTGISIDRSAWTYASLYLSKEFFKDAFEGWAPEFKEPVADNEISSIWYRNLVSVLSKSQCDVERQSALFTLTRKIAEQHSIPRNSEPTYSSHIPYIEYSKDFMRTYYGEPLKLNDIAKHSGLHPAYFLECFKKSEGITPYAFLTTIRLNAAKKALQQNQTPANAALACGFYDQSHFTKYFKGVFGITPAKYRQLAKR